MQKKTNKLTIYYKYNPQKLSAIGDYLDIDGTIIFRYNISKVERIKGENIEDQHKYTYYIHNFNNNIIYVYTASENKASEFEKFLGKKFKFKENNDISNMDKGTKNKKIGPGVILAGGLLLIFIIMIISLAIINGTGNGNPSKKKNPDYYAKEVERKTCGNKSDAYHKCSWSTLEQRCICKQR